MITTGAGVSAFCICQRSIVVSIEALIDGTVQPHTPQARAAFRAEKAQRRRQLELRGGR